MKRVVHLYDDEKIVERTQAGYLSTFPDAEHVGIIVAERPTLRYVRDSSGFIVVPAKEITRFARSFDFTNVTCVYIHFLSSAKMKFIKYVPAGVRIGWGIYGGDLYNRYLRYFGYPLIYGYMDSWLNRLLFPVKAAIRRPEFNKLMSKLAFVTACEPDYQLVKKYAKGSVPPQVDTFCYKMNTVLGALYGQDFVQGTQIIIGNSASPTNNHLYVLNYLKRLKGIHGRISLQMSYGADKRYVDNVEQAYSQAFGEQCECVRNFVPLEEYNRRLLDGGVFIYGNWRQEALGNILVAIYLGAKVYLSNKNPFFEYFRRHGVIVFELESMDETLEQYLTSEEKENNRHYIEMYHNESRKTQLLKSELTKYFV